MSVVLSRSNAVTSQDAVSVPALPETRGRRCREARRFCPVPAARGRRIVVLAVHHVDVDGMTYTGGAEKYVLTVVRALLDAGAVVHVGYSGTGIYHDLLDASDPRQLTVERTGWINAATSGDARIRLRTLRERRRWLRATGADSLFAVQQASGGAFGASLAAAKSLGLRVVASLRQLPDAPPPPTGRRWFGLVPSPEWWRRRLIWRRRLPAMCCDALIYNSRRVAQAYESTYGFPNGRARIIHNGEFPCNRRPAPPRALRIAGVGRVTTAKGADVLLDAFLIVARRHPECSLTYYGDGELIPTLQAKAAAHGLADRVRFPGHQADRDEMYANMDILVQPSRRESMSNSVIEAMARGIPCVATDVGGTTEAIIDGQTGYIVPLNDPVASAGAICKLLDAPDRLARFAGAAIARTRSRFDIRPLMRETVETILGINV